MSTYLVEPNERRASASELRAASSGARGADARAGAFREWLRSLLGIGR